MRTTTARAPLLAGLVLAACTAAGDTPARDLPADGPSTAPQADGVLTIVPGTATGPGISIEEALTSTAAEPLLVNGALFVDPDGSAWLCSAMAESFPPQCGGSRLEVRGLEAASLQLQEANNVRWAEAVQLLGTIDPR